MISRRRRRRRRRSGTNSSDAFDLFLDALCNALGVVMFIMLMVVIFTKSADQIEKVINPQEAAEEITRLESEAQQLEQKLTEVLSALASLPTIGDPKLIERWESAAKKLEESHERMRSESDTAQEIRKQFSARRKAQSALQERESALERSIESLARARTDKRGAIQFIRLARLRWDSRPNVVQILCADGRVAAAQFAGNGQRISEPKGSGTLVNDDKSAQAVFQEIFAGKSPADYRVEIVIWPSGFSSYKLLEKVIVDAKFAINPIPVPTGQTMGEEGPYRGVQ